MSRFKDADRIVRKMVTEPDSATATFANSLKVTLHNEGQVESADARARQRVALFEEAFDRLGSQKAALIDCHQHGLSESQIRKAYQRLNLSLPK